MRRTCARPAAGCAAVALLLAGGCLGLRTDGPAAVTVRRAGPVGADAIALDVALIEQPVGDRYLNRDLWAALDEGVVPLERKALLEDNGLRVGVTGSPPDELRALLTSQRSTPDPRELRTRAGTVKVLPLGEARPVCTFVLVQGGAPAAAEFGQAQCQLAVTPAAAGEGRVTLSFVPQVQHGAPKLLPQADPGGGPLHGRRPVQAYPDLGFEVTLGPRDFVLIGTRAESTTTLGHRCFVAGEGVKPVQRLLAIRAARPGAADGAPVTDGPAVDAASRPAPLATQAAGVVRGASH